MIRQVDLRQFAIRQRLFSTTKPTSTNNVEVRARFAPSPTGSIHLGGLRMALYNYIFAKQNGGSFVLRIEDTDQSRLIPGSADEIEEILNWAGLKPDESPKLGGAFGPYFQSKRINLYRDRAQELLDSGKAYRCFCSQERLELLRKYQARNREKPRYDGKCKDLSSAEVKEKLAERNNQHVVRFAIQPGQVVFDDLIYGPILNDLAQNLESDPVILKSDYFPTYHFANVVDDHQMDISHVLRGSEWLTSTAKHVQIYQAFGWQTPRFTHFPLITMRDGAKMSKRNNHSHVVSWRKAGYRPRALLNFLTTIGGGLPKEKQDASAIWDLQTLVDNFNFKDVACHSASVDLNRLSIINAKDLIKSWAEDSDGVLSEFKNLLIQNKINTDLDDDSLKNIIDNFITSRLTTLNDLLSQENAYIWRYPSPTWSLQEYLEKGLDLGKLIQAVIAALEEMPDLDDNSALISKMKAIAIAQEVNWACMMRVLRLSLTNCEHGQPVHDIFKCLGKERLLTYLNEALKYVKR